MNRSTRWVLAVVAVQAALIGLYWLVENRRAAGLVEALGTQPPQRIDMIVPALTLHRRDGSQARLSSSARPTLVHVWATWCPPCRTELPGLLELPSRHNVDVVAIALDPSWAPVEWFLGRVEASKVFLADSEQVERALAVTTLPVTFLVRGAERRITHRFDGTRDWTDDAFVRAYIWEHSADRGTDYSNSQ